ncbi:sulfotransferase family 2 domain-containing protein [Pseudomonadota bacterium]
MSWIAQLRKRHGDRKTLRKLRSLRTRISAAGYTLQSFDEHRCIFIHIPKCAGVSIAQSLFGNQGAGHYSASQYREFFGDATYDDYFTFAFVRNPWDRLASAYHFLRRGGFNDADLRWASRHLQHYVSFDNFVKNWVTPEHVRSWVHFEPQCDYLCKADGTLDVDFIGRFERLEPDFQALCNKLGIDRALLSLNQGVHVHPRYQTLYDDQSRDIVSEVYARDIELLNYSFDG